VVILLAYFIGIVKIKLVYPYRVVEKVSMREANKNYLLVDRWVLDPLAQRKGLQLL